MGSCCSREGEEPAAEREPPPAETAGDCCGSGAPPSERPDASAAEGGERPWFRLGLAILLGGLTMYFTLGTNLGNPEGLTRTVLHSLLAAVALATIAALGGDLFRKGWRALRRGRIGLEHAFLLGILGAFGASVYSSVTGEGDIYYEVVVLLFAIYYLGQVLVARQMTRRVELERLVPGLDERCRIRREGRWVERPVDEVVAGDRVHVTAGAIVPVDGAVREGRAYVEQQSYTGEMHPVPVGPDGAVIAGSRVLDGDLLLEAAHDGRAREIDRLLESLGAESGDSPTENLCRRLLNGFVPVVFLVAVATGIAWTLAGEPAQGWFNALAVTVVACPCALGIAIPLAVQRGRLALRLRGLVGQDADTVERLARVTAVVFDKTGTLSHSRLTLERFDPAPGAPAGLLDWIAAVQRRSVHPVARPFWRLGGERTPAGGAVEVTGLEVLPGRGVRAEIRVAGEPRELHLVNGHYLGERSLEKTRPEDEASPGGRRLYALVDGALAGVAHLGETPRDGSVATIEELRDAGLPVALYTGDDFVPGSYARAGATVAAGLTSREKAGRVRERQAAGERLLVIGDGLNDGEALRAAELGIALESGHRAAGAVAACRLAHDDLSVLPGAIRLARRLRSRLHRLLAFSLGYNVVGVGFAVSGTLHPVVAAVLMFAASLSVIWRVLSWRFEDEASGAESPPEPTAAPAAPPEPAAA